MCVIFLETNDWKFVPSPLASSLKPPAPSVWVAHGQCIEHFGVGEAYLPVLAALGQLGREAQGQRIVEALQQYAPTWLVQMPALVQPDDFESLQRRTAGATRTRMLREMAEALEALTIEQPLVLVLEDLHWSDPSTLELLSFVARRRQLARLLVLGTYRPVEMLTNGHPLRAVTQELQLHRHCEEIPVELLTEEQVAEYLEARLRGAAHTRVSLQKLAPSIHRRTEGNPLFMVSIVDDLLMQDAVDSQQINNSTPTTIRKMIERQFDHIHPNEQHVLAVASVAGANFSAAVVAAGTKVEVGEVETHCAALIRREQFLWRSDQSHGPERRGSGRYRFRHALYQEVIYERVLASQKIEWHRRIGERLESLYGQRAGEIAAELSVHFEHGQDYGKAVRYLQQAGEKAVRRSAYQEASTLLIKGLNLLQLLPNTPERIQQELSLQIALGDALIVVSGYTAPEVEKTVLRTWELCQQLGETPQLFSVLFRLALFYITRGELQTTLKLSKRMMQLAQSVQDPYLLAVAHMTRGCTLFWLGELPPARPHLEQAIVLYNPQQHPRPAVNTADPRIDCLSYTSWTLWYLGYPDQGLKRSQEELALAAGLSHPFSLVYALANAALFHLLRREGQLARERAEAALTLAVEQGFPYWIAEGTIMRGAALVEQGQVEEGIAQMQQGLAAHQTMGTEVMRTNHLPLLAAACVKAGRAKEGLSVVAEVLVLVEKIEQRVGEAELYRLKGTLTLEAKGWRLETGPSSLQASSLKPLVSREVAQEAEEYFLKAIEIAQKQQAKSLELRAATSLARLWQQQDKHREARPMLSAIYNWFTEGFDTKDLQEAKALLQELRH